MKNPRLASIIKEQRAARVLTQEHLAQLAEVDIRTIQRLESTGTCNKETLMAIAEAFNMDAKDLRKRRSKRLKAIVTCWRSWKTSKEELIPVTLHEVIGPKDLIDLFAGCHAGLQDFPDDLTSEQAELIGFVMDSLQDYADIQNDALSLRANSDDAGHKNQTR